jgi:phosphate:Na+ symporter
VVRVTGRNHTQPPTGRTAVCPQYAGVSINQLARLRDSDLQAAQASSIHLDLLRDIKLINSHIIAAAAYPVLERTGALLPSRLT